MNSERFPWHEYGKKVRQKILHPKQFGCFTLVDAHARKMHFAEGRGGSFKEGNFLHLYWLVDPEDGIIVDCKYQHFGDAILIAIAEVTVELLVGKNYHQAKHLTRELIEKNLQEKLSSLPQINKVLDAIDEAASQCSEIPLPKSYVTPLSRERGDTTVYPEWESLPKERKLQVIEEFFTEEIRPYIELDEGGVKILDLKDNELHIAYEGACTTCYSSMGTTLSSIQQLLQNKLHPAITVIPSL